MPQHHNLHNPSEGLEWSAGSYNPKELEEWKRKIYGQEYYDETTPAMEAPIWNQPTSEPIPIQDGDGNNENSENDNNNNNGSSHGNNNNNNNNSNSNHGSTRSGILRSSKKKQEYYKYSNNDVYFNNNIAAVAANWDDEDNNNHSYCFNFYPMTAKLQEYYDKYLKKQKRGVWIIALALLMTLVATVSMFRMTTTDAFADNNSAATSEIRPSLFDTEEAMLVEEPTTGSLFDTTSKEADLFDATSNNNDSNNNNSNYNSDAKPSPFETKTAQMIVEERNSPGGENHGKLRTRGLLLEDVKTKSQLN